MSWKPEGPLLPGERRARSGTGRTAVFVAGTSADDRWGQGPAPHRAGARRHGLLEGRILGNHENGNSLLPRTGFSAGDTRGTLAVAPWTVQEAMWL